MSKNDFDADFGFDEEESFDPKEYLEGEDFHDDINLDEFSDEELGLDPEDSDPVTEEPLTQEDTSSEDTDIDDLDFAQIRPNRHYAPDPEEVEPPDEESPEYDESEGPEDEPLPDEDEEAYDEEDPPHDRRKKPRKEVHMPKMPKVTLPKLHMPRFFRKFIDVYFAPLVDKSLREEPHDPNNPRRHRRKSKMQIFKEIYLPPILVCLCLVLVLTFVAGAISGAIDQKKIDNLKQQSQLQASSDAAALAEQEYKAIMDSAAELASEYNYAGAINLLDSYADIANHPEMTQLRSQYVTAQSQMVDHSDPSLIPNLSFHVLIADPVRAFADQELGGQYNRNFVTTDEFTKILSDLYNNGYVLVDFDSFVDKSTNVDGSDLFQSKPISLPADKKPIMLTETMVNYFKYMIDGNGDGEADAKGAGFASKLVLQGNDIKAEFIDSAGNTLVGDYDFVPILETFIKNHPDFSYQGARAVLAVTGTEGVFGYRINTENIATKGTAYHDEQVAGAKKIVQALQDRGYTIASYTYGNVAYKNLAANKITADLQSWASQVTAFIGEIDTIVFARESTIDFSGSQYDVLYTSGFRYFISSGTEPWAEVKTAYVRQNRIMVTGNAMAWKRDRFNGMFDCAAILDVTHRGDVPN